MGLVSTALLASTLGGAGWYWFSRNKNKNKKTIYFDKVQTKLHHDYFRGLNYLINEQPDKAVDVFIHLLEVDSDTVEMHLALGNLFRQRGEVDRAIRIHQNLIARPQLGKSHRLQAIAALGEDYLRAGVLDRAEKLFLELVKLGDKTNQGLRFLLVIYQREKEWLRAIEVAKKLSPKDDLATQTMIAHFYCELVLQVQVSGDSKASAYYLKQAVQADKRCVRVSMLKGQLAQAAGDYHLAIKYYQHVKKQNTDYVSEVISPIVVCYEKLGDDAALKQFLMRSLDEFPNDNVVFAISHYLQRTENSKVAIAFLTEQIKHTPSLRGLKHLVKLYVSNSDGDTQSKLTILENLISSYVDGAPFYQCCQCGFSGQLLNWQCPSCHRWETVKPLLK